MKVKKIRRKGTGTLEQRGNVYYARWWDRNGKRQFRTTGCTSRDQALIKLEEFTRADLILNDTQKLEMIKAKIETNLGIIKKIKQHELKISDILTKFFLTFSLDATEGTKKSYRYTHKTLSDWLKIHHPDCEYMDDISIDIAKEYVSYKRTLLGNDSLNMELARLKRVWKCLEYDNIWNFYENVKKSVQTRDTFTDKEVLSFLPKLKVKGERWFEFVLTIMLTGMRSSDAKTLNIKEVNLKTGMMTKRMRKNGAEKTLPIHPGLVKTLSTLEPDPDGYYFPHQREINDCNAVFKTVLKHCGIQTSFRDENGRVKQVHSLHSLRHYWVSTASHNGLPMQLCADYVGDKSQIIKKYYHPSTELLRDNIQAIPQFQGLDDYDTILKKSEAIDVEAVEVLPEPDGKDLVNVRISKSLFEEIVKNRKISFEENLRLHLTELRDRGIILDVLKKHTEEQTPNT